MDSGKIITGVLLGVVVGILIAPDKGSETRKKLSRTAGNIADSIKDLIENARDEVNNLADMGIDAVENVETKVAQSSW